MIEKTVNPLMTQQVCVEKCKIQELRPQQGAVLSPMSENKFGVGKDN